MVPMVEEVEVLVEERDQQREMVKEEAQQALQVQDLTPVRIRGHLVLVLEVQQALVVQVEDLILIQMAMPQPTVRAKERAKEKTVKVHHP